jgi:hypothetical protein
MAKDTAAASPTGAAAAMNPEQERLFTSCMHSPLPDAALAVELRNHPDILRRVLQQYCDVPLTLSPHASVPSAPLWIAAVMNGGDRMESLKGMLTECGFAVCGRSLRPREVAFKCLSCAADPTCIMCSECFQRSPCRNHEYRMIHSAAGMCDCGDPTAWKPEGFCSAHQGVSGDRVLEKVPIEEQAWISECLQAAIRFAIRCTHTAFLEASQDENIAGKEKLVVAAERALTMLRDFASISDASRRLVANAFAGNAVLNDVPDIPRAPKNAIGAVDSDDDEAALEGNEDVDHDAASSSTSSSEQDSDDERTHVVHHHHHHHHGHHQHTKGAAKSLFDQLTSAPLGAATDSTSFEQSVADRMANEHVHRAVHRFTLMDQVFLLDMSPPPKSAGNLLAMLAKLLGAIGVDSEFRRLYLRSFAATAWHQALSHRAKGSTKKGKLVYLKAGQIEQLAVQVLTVGPLVDEALIPAANNAPTLISALLGGQLMGLARRGRRLLARNTDLIVERRGLRRRLNFSSLYHMRYACFTSLTPKVILAHRHLFRAYCILVAARQGSDYFIERNQERKTLDYDLWDVDSIDTNVQWVLHDALKEAVQLLVSDTNGSADSNMGCAAALELPAEHVRPDMALAPPTDLTTPGFARLVLRCDATPEMPHTTACKTQVAQLPPWVAAVRRCFASLFEDMGELLMDVSQSRRKPELLVEITVMLQPPPTAPNNQIVQGGPASPVIDDDASQTASFLTVRREEAVERRVALPWFNLLQADTHFTFHTPLSRLAALLSKAIITGSNAAATADLATSKSTASADLLLRTLVAEALTGPAEAACESEQLVPALIDAAATPIQLTGHHNHQLWRADFCGIHRHIAIYHSFQSGHNQELDLFMLQLLTATFGASYVSTQLLLRFSYFTTEPNSKRDRKSEAARPSEVSSGHWHLLRLCLSIATDDSKTSLRTDSRARIVHALARRMMKRSDLDRFVLTFENDDDQKQLARARAIDAVLKEIAVVEKRKEGNVYRLKPEAWGLVNPYYVGWTTFDLENATEAHELQNKTHYSQQQGKKPPRRPAVITVPEHCVALRRVEEVLHTVSFWSVALEPLLLRAAHAHPDVSVSSTEPSPDAGGKAKGAKKLPKPTTGAGLKLPKPTSQHVMTAIDAVAASIATAKRLPNVSASATNATVRGLRWPVYEEAVRAWHASATWSAPQMKSKLLRELPVDTSATEGLLNKALVESIYSIIHVNGLAKHLPEPVTGLAALRTLVEKADVVMDDIPAHYVTLLHGIIGDLEATVGAADGADGVADEKAASGEHSGSGTKFVDPEEAAMKKKAVLKNRQAALMAKLRKRSATSVAAAEETLQSNADAAARGNNGGMKDRDDDDDAPRDVSSPSQGPAAANRQYLGVPGMTGEPSASNAFVQSLSVYDAVSDLHLGDCTSAFEQLECLCAFCNEPAAPNKPLSFLAQTARSGVLTALQPPAESANGNGGVALGTAHVNLCGHMAHTQCFERRVGHTGSLRDRSRDMTDLQAFLRGFHFKGMRYLTEHEGLCPVCSRAVSALCPAASAHFPPKGKDSMTFLAALARSAIGVPINKELKREDFDLIRGLAYDTPPAPPTSEKARAREITLYTVFAALRCAAQQAAIAAVSASAGRSTTVRSFSGIHAAARAVMRAVQVVCSTDRDAMDALVRFVKASVELREPHSLAMALLASYAFPDRYPTLEEIATSARRAEGVTSDLVTPASSDDGEKERQLLILRRRWQIRVCALLKMLATHAPLHEQHQVLLDAGSVEELVGKISFDAFDAPQSSSDTTEKEVARLRGLIHYTLAGTVQTDDDDDASSQDSDDTLVPVAVEITFAPSDDADDATAASIEPACPASRQLESLSRLLTRHVPDRFTQIVVESIKASCASCGKNQVAFVRCLNCGIHLCSRAEKPELTPHAQACGNGTALFLEIGTSRLVVVQTVNGRAAMLPPVHVDLYMEPDINLQRGLPLLISRERVVDLVLPWVSCSWDHQTHVLHSDTWKLSSRPI